MQYDQKTAYKMTWLKYWVVGQTESHPNILLVKPELLHHTVSGCSYKQSNKRQSYSVTSGLFVIVLAFKGITQPNI